MKKHLLFAAVGSLAAFLCAGAGAQTNTFNFENQAGNIGNSIALGPIVTAVAPSIRTLILSQTGLTALPSPSSGFTYLDNNQLNVGTNLNHVVIGNTGDGSALETLTLTFAQPVTSVNFGFATVPVTVARLITLSATTNNASVFASGTGVFNAGSTDNEGSLSLTGGTFTILNLFLSGTATTGDTFAVDNFVVTPSVVPVPEPGSIALLAGMGLPVAWNLRRKYNARNAR